MRIILHHTHPTSSNATLADIDDPSGQTFFEQGLPVVVTLVHGNTYEISIKGQVFRAKRANATDDDTPVRIYHTLPA